MLQYFKEVGTNWLYHTTSYIEHYQFKEEVVYLLGTPYDLSIPQQRSLFISRYQSTIWITYRKNIKLKTDLATTSDTGWGCMIRVGQMVMAQALRRYFNLEQESKLEKLVHIIGAFVDNDDGKDERGVYSIQKISDHAKKNLHIKPGEWFSPSSIAFTIKEIHQLKPIRNGENLCIEVFNNSSLYVDQLIEIMTGREICQCPALVCEECINKHHSKVKPVFFFLLCRIGTTSANKECIEFLQQLMEHPCSLGIIGGRPEKAHYFLGKSKAGDFFFLDPHYVQDSTSMTDLPQHLSSYFCKDIRTISKSRIDPSVGLCFYVRNIEELSSLMTTFEELTKTVNFLYFSKITELFIRRQKQEEDNKRRRKLEDEDGEELKYSPLSRSVAKLGDGLEDSQDLEYDICDCPPID